MLHLALLLSAYLAQAPQNDESIQKCQVRYETHFIRHFADLPENIRTDILKGGPIADVGKPYNDTDDIENGSWPRRALVSAGFSHHVIFVWIDHGGLDHHSDVLGFRRLGTTENWERSATLSGDACIAINAILDGVTTHTMAEP